MAFFAKLNDDERLGPPPSRERLLKGWRGIRSYRVECADPELAWDAGGLPQPGESWSDLLKDLRVVSVRLRRIGGRLTNPGGDIPGGLSIFEVQYETPGLSGKIPYHDGLKFTRFEPSTTELTVYQNAGEDDNDPFKGGLIAQGRGAQKKVPTLAASVFTYHSLNWDNLAPILALQGFVNKDDVLLPAILGGSKTYTMKPNQVLFLTPEIDQVANLVQVKFNLELAPDFYTRFQRENADGVGVGPVYKANVYQKAELGGLW